MTSSKRLVFKDAGGGNWEVRQGFPKEACLPLTNCRSIPSRQPPTSLELWVEKDTVLEMEMILFRNHYSFMSIWKVQHASSLQLSLKRILSVLEVMYHMWEVWKLVPYTQQCWVWDDGCHLLVEVILHHLLYHLVFQIISYSYFLLPAYPNKLLSKWMSHQSPTCPATLGSLFP